MSLLLLFLAGLLPPAPARAVDHETLAVLGWKYGACAVALKHFGYPAPGAGMGEDPIMVRVGALSIPPGRAAAKPQWIIASDGPYAYYASDVKAALSKLAAAGYSRAGFIETVRPDPVAPQPGLEALLRSTAALSATAPGGWPDRWDYRLAEIFYSPLSDCALVVYRLKNTRKDIFHYVLTRTANARVRAARARAHVENGMLLLNDGEIDAALAETAIAARLAPESAPARYHHAMLLCLTGSLPEALEELEAALKLDRKLKVSAREERNFETLFKDRRFKKLTGA